MRFPLLTLLLAALAAVAFAAQSNESICRQKSQRTGSLAAAAIRSFCSRKDLVANSKYAVSRIENLHSPSAFLQISNHTDSIDRWKANTPAPTAWARTLSSRPRAAVRAAAIGSRRGIVSARCMRLVRRGIAPGMAGGVMGIGSVRNLICRRGRSVDQYHTVIVIGQIQILVHVRS